MRWRGWRADGDYAVCWARGASLAAFEQAVAAFGGTDRHGGQGEHRCEDTGGCEVMHWLLPVRGGNHGTVTVQVQPSRFPKVFEQPSTVQPKLSTAGGVAPSQLSSSIVKR